MNNINTRLERSNIFYDLDNLVLFGERPGSEYVDTDILFGEHTEIEMDFLTPESKVDLYENLMNSWTPDAKIDSIRAKTFDEEVTSPSYEEFLDFVSFDSKKDFPKTKTLEEDEPYSSKDLKDKVKGSINAEIAGTSLLVSAIFFAILAVTCSYGTATFVIYSTLSAATATGSGVLFSSKAIEKIPHYNVLPTDLL